MLHEAQEELKNLRNRNYPTGTPRRYHPLGLYPMVRVYVSLCSHVCVRFCVSHPSWVLVFQDSLAAEIEGTMRKELSLDDPECKEQKYVWGSRAAHQLRQYSKQKKPAKAPLAE